MIWQKALGVLTILALFSPLLIITALGLIRYKSYLPLFFYCGFSLLYTLMTEDYISMPRNMVRTFGVINNLLDIPLMFFFMFLLTKNGRQRKTMSVLLAIFLCFELVIISFFGLSVLSITIIMGPGLLLIFGYALGFFVQTVKQSFIHHKAISKAVLASAICFAYGCFFIIYLMYYLYKVPNSPHMFIIYFIVTIIFCSLLSAGLMMESKRKRKLEELLATRKELLHFFADEKKPAISQETAGQWRLN
jgi:hypothetical protein